METDGNQKDDKVPAGSGTQCHSDEDAVEEDAQLEQETLHRFLLVLLFGGQNRGRRLDHGEANIFLRSFTSFYGIEVCAVSSDLLQLPRRAAFSPMEYSWVESYGRVSTRVSVDVNHVLLSL